jgi:hypothetical protein
MVNEKLAPYLPDPYVVKNKDTYAFANHEK